ncbi:hypothetical protein AGDE_16272 [Angomonas deanei]|uniref:Uncharacterized protein n=1 Tax=Angomonas deanei TaxID=59799 RepID=A0A7G2CIS2_9TRYP|nr:hypothetical protein AGDE_16272 [Angomonas deanei]CAD2219319.1 hypothetical protein, conserved [Angomonas deanei]|eukprot:EPY17400.1 hypothetical protein AGDE_16272 [Angomonas deanei]
MFPDHRYLVSGVDTDTSYSTLLIEDLIRLLPPRVDPSSHPKPRYSFISLRYFLANVITEEMRSFLPDQPIKLFLYAAQQPCYDVQLFEYRFKNFLCLTRRDQPLPPRALRTHYREEELLFMLAAQLIEKPRVVTDLLGRLPFFARETLRSQGKTLQTFLSQFPALFAITHPNGKENTDTRGDVVTLLDVSYFHRHPLLREGELLSPEWDRAVTEEELTHLNQQIVDGMEE